MANPNRFSTYTSVSAGSGSKHDNASASASGAADKKRDLWNSMLDSVASGRKLPERNLLVFGGSVDSQREFLESLSLDPRRNGMSMGAGEQRLPPVANNFALGYTYYDVVDADQEGDILARISLYLLSKPSPTFSSLLQPLLTPASIPNTLIVILLDWAQPWLWLRQLREWILLLRTVLVSLSPDCKEVMEEAMVQWRERGRGGPVNLDGTTAAVDGDALPPGPGEWEDALGLPLCVVCQNSEKTDILEKTQGWKDDEFDLVLQYLRTVLVKHGASLIYTTPNVPSQLPTLVHACLGVTSLLKRQPLKAEVIKRTEVVVPSNWDSWTKILVVREGFEVDKVSTGWSMDLQRPFPVAMSAAAAAQPTNNGGSSNSDPTQQTAEASTSTNGGDGEAVESGEYSYDGHDHPNNNEGGPTAYENGGYYEDNDGYDDDDEDPDSAVSQFERAIRDPGMDVLALAGQGGDLLEEEEDEDEYELDASGGGGGGGQRRRRRRRRRHQQLEVETEDVQLFLGDQLKLLDQFRQKDEAKRDKEAKESKRRGDNSTSGSGGGGSNNSSGTGLLSSATGAGDGGDPAEVISSHIGPVQFNIGGIQVDADDMLERIKNRHGYGSTSPEPMSPETTVGGAGSAVGGAGGPAAVGNNPGGKDGASTLVPENVDTEKMTAFFAGLMNRPSQTGKT